LQPITAIGPGPWPLGSAAEIPSGQVVSVIVHPYEHQLLTTQKTDTLLVLPHLIGNELMLANSGRVFRRKTGF
jgi:hypothetical protein